MVVQDETKCYKIQQGVPRFDKRLQRTIRINKVAQGVATRSHKLQKRAIN